MIYIPDNLKKHAPYQREDYKPGYITYLAHLRAYGVYSALYGPEQSAGRLAERGGFGEKELDVFYPEWRNHIIQNKQRKEQP